MRGFLIFLGLLLVLAGGAVAGAQYAPVDLSVLGSVKGAKEFLLSPTALYAGGGAAGFGLLLILIGAVTGGKRKDKPVKAAKAAPAKAERVKAESAKAQKVVAPEPASRKPEPSPAATAPKPPAATVAMAPVAAAPVAASAPPPAPAQQAPASAPKPPPPPPVAAPQPSPASSKPTASAQPPTPQAASQDPRLVNRKRVQDLVTINDAIKAYHAKHGGYPKAEGLAGFLERGAAWIPGLAPDFIKALPRDPALSDDKAGPQYVYVSDGTGYKLLAQGVSLVGGTNVEVLGVRIDMTRQPTPENAAFGFWTEGFASA